MSGAYGYILHTVTVQIAQSRYGRAEVPSRYQCSPECPVRGAYLLMRFHGVVRIEEKYPDRSGLGGPVIIMRSPHNQVGIAVAVQVPHGVYRAAEFRIRFQMGSRPPRRSADLGVVLDRSERIERKLGGLYGRFESLKDAS